MMKRSIVFLFVSLLSTVLLAQNSTIYRGEREKIFDLVHTKLKVDFNIPEETMNGEEWVTVKPHFYEQDKLVLDAKGMLIHKVSMQNQTLQYTYDDYLLTINLPKKYTKEEELTIYIKYTARPNKVKQDGSLAILSARGLYFIDPRDEDPNKPTQIWTQGETEASSCWFPTIDAPNQKTSQEIYITVPDEFVTLSNGKLEKQSSNGNGTRTDYWNFTKKHAPYLFFMGIGEFEIVKDQYKDVAVDYYLEKKYAPYAKEIFGDTPEMIKFFSELTGVEYPWNKYAQIVCRDYVSGAMENTTAVIHGEKAHQVSGQLVDKNVQENTIAHEIFHHWFGNLVTTESWSNLAMNESFANYSEYLWREYKYGKQDADAHLFTENTGYKRGENPNKHLIRFYYDDKEDMFDAVSYNKGGTILHMLRNYVGDEAFFKGLNKYLTDNAYGTGEAHQLRLALEDVSGRDLNVFFNQWFYGAGHPSLNISQDLNKIHKTITVNVYQTQDKVFSFPLTIDVFEGPKATRHKVFVDSKNREASFTFPYNEVPKLVQVNADGVLLCDLTETKITSDYIFQLKHAENFEHKRTALLEVAKKQEDNNAFEAIAGALNDPYYKIRILALEHINLINKNSKKKTIQKIIQMAENDPKTLVQATAIETLGKLTDPLYQPIFEKGLQSKSYAVVGKSLVALYYINKPLAIQTSKALPDEVKEIIATPLTRIYLDENDETQLKFIAGNVISGMYLTQDKEVRTLYKKAFDKIAKGNDTEAIQNLTADIVNKGTRYQQYGFDTVGIDLMRKMIQEQKVANKANEQRNIAVIQEAMEKLLEIQH